MYSCHHQSVNKSCVLWYHEYHTFPDSAVAQIIEEQLTFPSGTATAQLISVLHKMPPLDTLHKRKGYTALDSEDAADSELAQEPREGVAAEVEEEDEEVKEIVDNEGWSALGWSFFASAALTVCGSNAPIARRAFNDARNGLVYSCSPSSSPSHSLFRYLVHTSRRTGCGHSPLHCRMLDRGSSWASRRPLA